MNNSFILEKLYAALQSRSTARIVAESGAFFIIWLVIMIGNSLTLYIVLSNRQLRTVPNLFIVSLAFSDIGMGVLSMPMCFAVLALSYWPFSDVACQYEGFIAVTMGLASVQSLTWTAINRYYRVVRTNEYRKYFTMRSTITYITSGWILSAISLTPYLLAGHRMIFHPGKYFCYAHIDVAWYTAFVAILYVGVPINITLFCYFRVFQVVKKHNNRFSNSSGAQSNLNVEEIKITRTLFIVLIVYMTCWTPILIMDLIDTFRGFWSLSREAYTCYSFLAVVSSATNPIIYGFMNPVFKKEYLKILCCKKNRNGPNLARTVNVGVTAANRSKTTANNLQIVSVCSTGTS